MEPPNGRWNVGELQFQADFTARRQPLLRRTPDCGVVFVYDPMDSQISRPSAGQHLKTEGKHMGWVDIVCWSLMAFWGLALFPAFYGVLFPRFIRSIPPLTGEKLPSLSLIVPAKNEEEAIEEALRRMLQLDYPDYEVIAINDRSDDQTGAIMDRIAAEVGSPLQVVHVKELPTGWLGKNHAMSQGIARARGEFILLTDGDVMFDPLVLRRAMNVVQKRQLDHLVLVPETTYSTFLEAALINFFGVLMMATTRFPIVRWKWFKDAYLGVGAFNLVRRTAYDTIGGFEPLKLEVADDLMLGRLIKHSGLRQDVFGGQGSVRVKWQSGGVWAIVRGLEKNAFSGTNYSVGRTIAAVSMLCLIFVGPVVALCSGWVTTPALIMAIGSLLLSLGTARMMGFPIAVGLLYPWAVLVLSFIILRSMVLTLRQGGVRWRDTFYSLADLRKARLLDGASEL
ncbi:MAG: glycosyltransferase [Planctomycetota bacterium]|nr:MAG: glycosyltransferase [Planctomycetota bacterium]